MCKASLRSRAPAQPNLLRQQPQQWEFAQIILLCALIIAQRAAEPPKITANLHQNIKRLKLKCAKHRYARTQAQNSRDLRELKIKEENSFEKRT